MSLKVATQQDFEEIHRRRLLYMGMPDIAPIPINEKTIAIYDDTSPAFVLATWADLGEKTPQSDPFWFGMCLETSGSSYKAVLGALALELIKRGYGNTRFVWRIEGSVLTAIKNFAIDNLLSPRKLTLNGKTCREFTANEGKVRLGI